MVFIDTLYVYAASFLERGIKTMKIELEGLNAGMEIKI
jgi:hypothetical protein